MTLPSESILLDAVELFALARLGGGANAALGAIGLDAIPSDGVNEVLQAGARSLHERGGLDDAVEGVDLAPCLGAVAQALQHRPRYLALESNDDLEAIWVLPATDGLCISLQILHPPVFVARAVECSSDELVRRLAESFLAENEPRVVSLGMCEGKEVIVQRVIRTMPDESLLVHGAADDPGRGIERHQLADALVVEPD